MFDGILDFKKLRFKWKNRKKCLGNISIFYIYLYILLNSLLKLHPNEGSNILFANLIKSKEFSVDFVFNKRRKNREALSVKNLDLELE